MEDALNSQMENLIGMAPENREVKTNTLNIPTEKKLCQAERFIEGLRMIAAECGMDSIEWNPNTGIIVYYFKDGSEVGSLRAHKMARLIKEK